MSHPAPAPHEHGAAAWPTTGHAAAPHLARTCPWTWAVFFLLGCGVLAPWNAFISAADYYEAVFPGRHVDRLLTVCYLPVCWAMLAVVVAKGHALPTRARILGAFATFGGTMLAVPLMDYLIIGGQSEGPPAALALVLLSVALVGCWDGLSQAAVFGEAAPLASAYTHAVVGGTASSGLLVSLLRIITKAALPDTLEGLRTSTALYFAAAAAISAGCFVAYAWGLPRCAPVRAAAAAALRAHACTVSPAPSSLELAQELAAGAPAGAWTLPPRCDSAAPLRRDSSSPQAPWLAAGRNDRLPLLGAHALPSHAGSSSRSLSPRRPHGPITPSPPDPLKPDSPEQGFGWSDGDGSWSGGGTPACPPHGHTAAHARMHGGRREWRSMARRIWRLGVALALVYVVTLSIFPGFLAEDVQNERLGSWYPVLLIALFNAADLVGKMVPLCGLRLSQSGALAAAGARLAFLPAFVGATLAGAPAGVIAALTALLGVSNGFLTALIMTHAPEGMEPWEADLCETLLVFSLVGGLTVGAFCGWLWLL